MKINTEEADFIFSSKAWLSKGYNSSLDMKRPKGGKLQYKMGCRLRIKHCSDLAFLCHYTVQWQPTQTLFSINILLKQHKKSP